MKDLTVEIPRKYKKALTERFSLKNARKSRWGTWEIKKSCPLCKDYHIRGNCVCPFIKFEMINVGCLVWVGTLLKFSYHFHILHIQQIWWDEVNDKQARKELKLLKKKARELIKWV